MGPNYEELRASFDRSAELYQQARPDYPDALFDRLLAVTGLQAGDEVLEWVPVQARRPSRSPVAV